MRVGVEALGVYVPPGRLATAELRQFWPGVGTPGGVRSVSVAGFDEDIVTMGVEAAQLALDGLGGTVASIDLLAVATCSSPYVEHSAAAEIARGLGVPAGAALLDLAGSTLGGVSALQAAWDAVETGRASRALVIASERRRGAPGTAVEALGAGAVALLIGADAPSTLIGRASYRHGVPTRWRSENSPVLHAYDDTRYELVEQIQPSVAGVLAGLNGADSTLLALGPLDVRSRTTLLRLSKAANDEGAFDFSGTGDLGCAGPLVDLAEFVATNHDSLIACVGIEPGSGAAGLTLRTEGVVPVFRRSTRTVPVTYVEYLQRFGALEGPTPPSPIVPYAATPGAARSDIEGSLVGDRCEACGALNVPPRRFCVDCGGTRFTRQPLSREGTVVTFNVQHVVAISPEPSPVAVGVIRLKGEPATRAGQVSAMFCDSDLDELSIGQEAELVYRRIGIDDGLVKYGWKARTVPRTGGDDPNEHGNNERQGEAP